ncbi:16S rRNA (guanine(527)-N(7))-methyltransferase RsmG [Nitrospira sp. Nam80]
MCSTWNMSDEFERHLNDAAKILSISIDSHQSRQFQEYSRTLDQWNRATNLTAIEDPGEVAVKHFIDSIMPLKFGLPLDGASILDVGSGAGFPSIPLKIMKPTLSLTLLEPNSKKRSFLLYIIGMLRLEDTTVHGLTLKDFVAQDHDHHDCAVIRAVKFSLVGGDLREALNDGGTVLAYRSSAMVSSDIPGGFMKQHEWSYSLPFGHGPRFLTELGRFDANVPRGTGKCT